MKTFMVIMAGLMMACTVYADGLVYGLLAKSIDDQNFIDTASGCQEAAVLAGDRCTLIGGHGPASPRLQIQALSNALQTGRYSAFAVSVILSEKLADMVRKSIPVPVITFDSPFDSRDADVSLAYVGTDNVAFGDDLANIVKTIRPHGGTVFLMGDMHDTNLSQRIWGVRRTLSGKLSYPMSQRLNGEGSWSESPRSPWKSGDNIERSLDQVRFMLEQIRPNVFISVGQWPVVDPKAYREAVQPFYSNIVERKVLMVFGVGKITPELQALVDEGLIHGLVSINFFEIGRQAYSIMRDITGGKSVPKETFVPNSVLIVKQNLQKK